MTKTGVAYACGIGLMVIVGCAAPEAELAELPELQTVTPFDPASAGEDSVSFRVVSPSAGPSSDEWMQPRNKQISEGARVVISVPLDAGEQASADMSAGGLKTSGYFNELEQQVEFALMDLGFTLLDRSKFEAKLLEDDAIPGQTLQTLPELLLAARDGDVTADYVLQINQLEPLEGETQWIAPLERREVQSFAANHRGLAESGALAPFEIDVVEAVFNAKLIEVATGEVAWVGSHSVDSLDILPRGLEVTLTVNPEVVNASGLSEAAERHNVRVKGLWERASAIRGRLDDKTARLGGSARRTLIADYERAISQYTEALASAPAVDESQAQYDYDKAKVTMEPDLRGFFGGSGPSEEALEAHRLDLLRLATTELIGVIRVDD
jgi:hypothetical protein